MRYYTYRFRLFKLNIIAIIMLITMGLLTFIIAGNLEFLNVFCLKTIILLIFWLMLHELLHGLGFLCLGEVSFKNITFGIELEKGILYCMCKEKISKENILIALIFPLFFIGIMTYIIGLSLNNNILIMLSIINIASASGDILMFLDILRMPRDIYYLDLDDTVGFTIISKESLEDKKYLGIKLVQSGKYKKSIKAKDYTKLKISKISKIILLILLILLIIGFFI